MKREAWRLHCVAHQFQIFSSLLPSSYQQHFIRRQFRTHYLECIHCRHWECWMCPLFHVMSLSVLLTHHTALTTVSRQVTRLKVMSQISRMMSVHELQFHCSLLPAVLHKRYLLPAQIPFLPTTHRCQPQHSMCQWYRSASCVGLPLMKTCTRQFRPTLWTLAMPVKLLLILRQW